MLEANSDSNLRITETNSEEEQDTDVVKLRAQLSRQEKLAKEAAQSCQQYKRINESLLQAMTQMTAENNRGYEAMLHRQRELELTKQEKHMQDMQRMMTGRLDAALSKAVSLENAKRQVEEQLQRARSDCLAKQQTIGSLCREVQLLRLEVEQTKQKQHLRSTHPSSHTSISMVSSESRSDELLTLNRRISEELQDKFRRIVLEQSEAHKSEKKILETTIETVQFENKLLKKDIDHLTKDLQKGKQELHDTSKRHEERLSQHQNKWRTLNEQHQSALRKSEERLNAKQQELKQARKDNAALRVKLTKATSSQEQSEKKIAELQRLLAEAKYHIINFDLENKSLNTKVKTQQQCMKKETQKLKEELIAVKQVELSRSRALDGLLSRASNTKPKTARSRHDSSHCSINLQRSLLGRSNAQNDPSLCNLLQSILSRASSTTHGEQCSRSTQPPTQRRSSPPHRSTNISRAPR